MSKTTVLIDGGFVCAQARYATGHLENSAIDLTGVAFGFLSKLLYLRKTVGPCRFVFAWDTRESFRKDAYSHYKEMRTKKLTPEEYEERKIYYKQVDRLRDDIIPRLGFKNTFYQPGLEADDMVAYVAKHLEGTGLIVSSDQDLYQLLTDDISMLIPTSRGKPPTKFTKQDFIIKYGIEPDQWWKAKAIMGCNSDNVRGCEGIGPTYTLRYLKGELSPDSKQYKSIKAQWDVVKRNVPLVKLPHKKTKPLTLREDDLSYQRFRKMCKELEFDSFLREEAAMDWNKIFGDSGKRVRERLNR